MATSIENEKGDVLWSPNDFGSYSIERVSLIANILKDLLSEVDINMVTKMEESSFTNVYTKEECNNMFITIRDAISRISTECESILNTKVSNEIPETSSSNSLIAGYGIIKIIYKYLNELYREVFRTDIVDASSTSSQLLSKVDEAVRYLGDSNNLPNDVTHDSVSKAIYDVDRKISIAINSLQTINSRLSNIEGKIAVIEDKISTLESLNLSDLSSDISGVNSRVDSIDTSISSIISRLDALEGNS